MKSLLLASLLTISLFAADSINLLKLKFETSIEQQDMETYLNTSEQLADYYVSKNDFSNAKKYIEIGVSHYEKKALMYYSYMFNQGILLERSSEYSIFYLTQVLDILHVKEMNSDLTQEDKKLQIEVKEKIMDLIKPIYEKLNIKAIEGDFVSYYIIAELYNYCLLKDLNECNLTDNFFKEVFNISSEAKLKYIKDLAGYHLGLKALEAKNINEAIKYFEESGTPFSKLQLGIIYSTIIKDKEKSKENFLEAFDNKLNSLSSFYFDKYFN